MSIASKKPTKPGSVTNKASATKQASTTKKANLSELTKPARKAPAKKVPAKKVPAKKVPAKKVPAKKVPAPSKSAATPAKKVVRKTATKAATKAATKGSAKAGASGKVTLRGRSVFVVQTTQAGVVVRSAWLSEDNKLQEMPAVFPSVEYAVNVLDDLKRQVLKHFERAAQVGTQVIASQTSAKRR